MAGKPQRSRPGIKDYGISTKLTGMLEWTWAEERLVKSRNYWVCSTRPDGRPHAAPVWGVWLEGALYFGSSPSSVKARNLKANPAVSAHLESGDEAVMIEGRAVEATDRATLERMAAAYGAKYPGFRPALKPDELFLMVRPILALAWTETDYPNSATRWAFDAA